MAAARLASAHAPSKPHVKPLALLPMADGSEELEVMTIYDVLTRGGVHVVTASVGEKKKNIIEGLHGMKLRACKPLEDCVYDRYDLIVLPGGLGAAKLRDCDLLVRMLKLQRQESRWIAAICSAPALVLEHNGLLDGPATCHPTKVRYMPDHYRDEDVVVTGHCVTSQGPGTAMKFALRLVSLLCGSELTVTAAQELLYPIP